MNKLVRRNENGHKLEVAWNDFSQGAGFHNLKKWSLK